MEKQNACALMDQTTNLNVVNAAESIVQVENVLLTRTISPHVFVMMRMLRAHLKVNTPIANAPWIVEKKANEGKLKSTVFMFISLLFVICY